jgi:mannonate dehydratase
MGIRVAVGQFHELSEERLRFAAQIGATGLQMNNPTLPGDNRWEQKDVRALVDQVEAAGLKFEAIENVPTHFYHKAMMGLDGRDEQIENYQATIRAVARAGIPVLGLALHAQLGVDHQARRGDPRRRRRPAVRHGGGRGQYRQSRTAPLVHADDARSRLLDAAVRQGRPADHRSADVEQLRVFHEGRAAGGRRGRAEAGAAPRRSAGADAGRRGRLFYKPENFKKAYDLVGRSEAWSLDLCLGCCSEMEGGKQNVNEMIEYFAPKGRISYIHFRDVKGSVPNFVECFIGDGNFDPAEVIVLLAKNGFDGFLLDDHVPKMDGDSDWNHRGRSHAIGYMQGLIRMAEFLGKA